MRPIHNPQSTKEFRIKLRKKMTQSEVFLWSKIKSKQLGYKFRRQHGIDNYIVDFYCHELGVIIELDGISHLSEKTYKKDLIKQKHLEEVGYIVKRYTDNQIINEMENVLKDLINICFEINKKNEKIIKHLP
jgi:very-short-patch-repair endonuclease